MDQQYVCVNEGEFGNVTVPLNIQVAGLFKKIFLINV